MIWGLHEALQDSPGQLPSLILLYLLFSFLSQGCFQMSMKEMESHEGHSNGQVLPRRVHYLKNCALELGWESQGGKC